MPSQSNFGYHHNQTSETETLDARPQLVKAKYFPCKVGVLRNKIICYLVFPTKAIQLWNENPQNPKISRNGMKTIKIGTTGNRLPKEGWKAYVAEGAYLAGRAATGGASTNCPLPPSLTHLQKGSKFGFFCITYSHLGKYSGKYNILSRAFTEITGVCLTGRPFNHWIINSAEIVSHWTRWKNQKRGTN